MHHSWLTRQFELLLDVCLISDSEAQFLGHFWPRNRSKFTSSVIFEDNVHWFHTILTLHAHWEYFMCISMMCPKGHISGPVVKVAAGFVRPSLLLSIKSAPESYRMTQRFQIWVLHIKKLMGWHQIIHTGQVVAFLLRLAIFLYSQWRQFWKMTPPPPPPPHTYCLDTAATQVTPWKASHTYSGI